MHTDKKNAKVIGRSALHSKSFSVSFLCLMNNITVFRLIISAMLVHCYKRYLFLTVHSKNSPTFSSPVIGVDSERPELQIPETYASGQWGGGEAIPRQIKLEFRIIFSRVTSQG
jgi:hypothetical protein